MSSLAEVGLFNAQSKKIIRDLLMQVETIDKIDDTENGFNEACHAFGVQNMAYLGVNLPKSNHQNYFIQNTYSEAWRIQYEARNYLATDPVVQLGMTATLPFDWRKIPTLTEAQKNFLDEAGEFGVGTQGLTFPVVGLGGTSGFFCVSANLNRKEWQDYKRQNVHRLRLMADIFHQNLISSMLPAAARHKPVLTSREIECLKWCAEGKTQQDIAEILNISPRTVRFFLESARVKLNCLNTTHTVITAITRGHFCP
jgi:DNA-binding CsgD family transcriptional regulator